MLQSRHLARDGANSCLRSDATEHAGIVGFGSGPSSAWERSVITSVELHVTRAGHAYAYQQFVDRYGGDAAREWSACSKLMVCPWDLPTGDATERGDVATERVGVSLGVRYRKDGSHCRLHPGGTKKTRVQPTFHPSPANDRATEQIPVQKQGISWREEATPKT